MIAYRSEGMLTQWLSVAEREDVQCDLWWEVGKYCGSSDKREGWGRVEEQPVKSGPRDVEV